MPDVRPPGPRADRPPLRALPSSDVDTTDWPAQAADTIEKAVQGVREKTTGPAITAVRWFVAGLFLATMGITVAILLAIVLVRVLDIFLPVWAAYLVLGLPLFIAGMVLLAKRHSPARGAT